MARRRLLRGTPANDLRSGSYKPSSNCTCEPTEDRTSKARADGYPHGQVLSAARLVHQALHLSVHVAGCLLDLHCGVLDAF